MNESNKEFVDWVCVEVMDRGCRRKKNLKNWRSETRTEANRKTETTVAVGSGGRFKEGLELRMADSNKKRMETSRRRQQ